jgi:ribosomal protein S18 acetylase RimI-like enzyme
VIEMRPATQDESHAWLDDWRLRLHAWFAHPDVPEVWVQSQVERRLGGLRAGEPSGTFGLIADGVRVGMLAAGVVHDAGVAWGIIRDVWIGPEFRRRGHGSAAVRAAETWGRDHGATVMQAVTNPADPAHTALMARYPVRARQMISKLSGVTPLAAGLEGGRMTAAEFAEWRADAVRGYAADMANSGTLPADEAAAASAAQFDQLLPEGLATSGHSFLTLRASGEVVATNWIGHHVGPGMSWVYGVAVRDGHRGKGHGRAAMIIGEQAAVEAGDTHLGLNVFGHNAVAISLYRSMGYRGYEDARSIDL